MSGARPAAGWLASVLEMHGPMCMVVTGAVAVQGHHVIEASWLRTELQAKVDRGTLIQILSDPRNGMPISRRAHERHDNWIRRIRRDELPASVFEFVEELDAAYGTRFEARLDRAYPLRRGQAA